MQLLVVVSTKEKGSIQVQKRYFLGFFLLLCAQHQTKSVNFNRSGHKKTHTAQKHLYCKQ